MSFGKIEYDELLGAFKCEICGNFIGSLGHHIWPAHKITTREYRKRFGINMTQSLVSTAESQKHAERARKYNNFGKLDPSKFNRFKKGDNTRQKYERSPQQKAWLSQYFSKKGREAIQRNRFLKRRLTNKSKSDTI